MRYASALRCCRRHGTRENCQHDWLLGAGAADVLLAGVRGKRGRSIRAAEGCTGKRPSPGRHAYVKEAFKAAVGQKWLAPAEFRALHPPNSGGWLVEAHRQVKMYDSMSDYDVARIHDETLGPH